MGAFKLRVAVSFLSLSILWFSILSCSPNTAKDQNLNLTSTAPPQDCSLPGYSGTLPSGQSVQSYPSGTQIIGSNCTKSTITCTNGSLTGGSTYNSTCLYTATRDMNCGTFSGYEGVAQDWYKSRGRCGDGAGLNYWAAAIPNGGTQDQFNISWDTVMTSYPGGLSQLLCENYTGGDTYNTNTTTCTRH